MYIIKVIDIAHSALSHKVYTCTLYAICRGVFRGGARGARAPPSASSPVLINSILGTTGSTAGLFNGCSTSVLSNPACISYLLTYYVLESRHRRDRDRHRQP